jgi:hypothetical protein
VSGGSRPSPFFNFKTYSRVRRKRAKNVTIVLDVVLENLSPRQTVEKEPKM